MPNCRYLMFCAYIHLIHVCLLLILINVLNTSESETLYPSTIVTHSPLHYFITRSCFVDWRPSTLVTHSPSHNFITGSCFVDWRPSTPVTPTCGRLRPGDTWIMTRNFLSVRNNLHPHPKWTLLKFIVKCPIPHLNGNAKLWFKRYLHPCPWARN